MEDKKIWCSLITEATDIKYALVMVKSLRAVNTKYECHCMVKFNTSSDMMILLEAHFDAVITSPEIIMGGYDYTKWNMFNPNIMNKVSKICVVNPRSFSKETFW